MNIVLVINGPNLGILGKRQVKIYGSKTLENIITDLQEIARKNNIVLEDFQNNVEGEIVNFLNEKFGKYIFQSNKQKQLKQTKLAGIIINPAAYTHTSVALRDALEVFKQENVPIFEVHLSNIYAREDFRHKSYVSPIATGVISGLGSFGYNTALYKIIEMEKDV